MGQDLFMRRFIFVIIVLLCCDPAYAFDDPAQRYNTAFSLHIKRQVSDWEVDNTTMESRISRIGLSIHEPLNEHLDSGIELGYLDLSQPDNTHTEGIGLTGGYLGLTLGTHLLRTDNLSLLLNLSYRYNSVEGSDNTTEASLTWHELQGGLSLSYSFERLILSAGVGQHAVDGEERVENDETRSIEQKSETIYSAGATYWVERTGYIGIQGQRGAQQSIRFVFGRQF